MFESFIVKKDSLFTYVTKKGKVDILATKITWQKRVGIFINF